MMVQGFTENLSSSEVTGWAFDDRRPGERVQVAAYVNDQQVGTGLADIFRPDLLSGDIGDGCHGFRIRFSREISLDNMQNLEVRATSRNAQVHTLSKLAPVGELQFTGKTEDPTQFPLFILGAPRSGTSAIGDSIRATTRYAGFNEGHFFNLFGRMLSVTKEYYRELSAATSNKATLISTLPMEYMNARLQDLFIDIARQRFASPYWLDKTPSNEMISLAHRLLSLWPNGKFIFMKRRAIENIASRQRKFPGIRFEDHCEGWRDSMYLWAAHRSRFAGKAIEIDQHTMAMYPVAVAAMVADLLGLSVPERDSLSHMLSQTRVEQTSADFRGTLTLETVGWSAREQMVFQRICAPMMQAYFYTEDGGYFESGRSDQGLLAV